LKSLYLFLLIALNFPINSYGQNAENIDRTYEKGKLVDGYKEGVWEYYDSGELKLKLDYTTGKLQYLAKDTSNFAIETENGWEIIYRNLKYPLKALSRSKTGTVLLGFEINLQGHIENLKILKDIGSGCGKEALKAFKLIPDYWLVAQKDGKQYKSRFILPIKFHIAKKLNEDLKSIKIPKKELKKLKKVKKQYFPSKYLREIVITAFGIKREKRRLGKQKRRRRVNRF